MTQDQSARNPKEYPNSPDKQVTSSKKVNIHKNTEISNPNLLLVYRTKLPVLFPMCQQYQEGVFWKPSTLRRRMHQLRTWETNQSEPSEAGGSQSPSPHCGLSLQAKDQRSWAQAPFSDSFALLLCVQKFLYGLWILHIHTKHEYLYGVQK